MFDKKVIIDLIKSRGPVLPVHISKDINQNILMTSAILSELVFSNQVKLTHAKIGSSPVYYLIGQEYKLQELLFPYLNEKDKNSYTLLKTKRILRDNELTPLERVSLRELKDFAKPLSVTTRNGKEIFWKWYLLSNDDAIRIIKSQILPEIKREAPVISTAANGAVQPEAATAPVQPVIQPQQEISAEQSPLKAAAEVISPIQPQQEQVQSPVEELIRPELKQAPVEKEVSKIPILPEKSEEKKPALKEAAHKVKPDKFLGKIKSFFEKNKINLLEHDIIKRESEIDSFVEIPSAVGMLKYYCKAKSKSKITDLDLSSAYIKGESNRLPILFLTDGIITKRAQEMLYKEFKNISFKRI